MACGGCVLWACNMDITDIPDIKVIPDIPDIKDIPEKGRGPRMFLKMKERLLDTQALCI